MTNIVLVVFPFIALAAAMLVGSRTMKKTGSASKAIKKHFMTVAVAVILCAMFTFVAAAAGDTSDTAATAAAASEAVASGTGSAAGMGFLGAALSIGLSAIGAGVALAAGAPAAIGAVSEDPKSFGKSMIFVVLGEAVALYGFVIAFMILAKIPTFAAL